VTGERETIETVTRLLGQEQGSRVVKTTLVEAGVPDLTTPTHRYRFAAVLIAKGDVLEAVGRAIRVQALLQGAQAE
jgi:hypothetical protein